MVTKPVTVGFGADDYDALRTVPLSHRTCRLAKACHRSSSDLHGHANHPSRHDHCRPGDVWIVAEYNHAHRSKRREPREKRAHRAQEFRGVDLLVRL